jgi:RNA polymerase sigma-70 factor (ECF subfamily)
MVLAATEPSVSDETLAGLASRGVSGAFAELFSRHRGRVLRLAARMSATASDAEEITQDTFLLAHRGMASFHGDSSFRTWLCRIAVNRALMHDRAARRRPVLLLGSIDSLSKKDPTASPEELVDRKALVLRLREAVARLDELHRAALTLRDIEDVPSEQAAAILGVSPDAVRQRARRARLKVREDLGDVLSPREAR